MLTQKINVPENAELFFLDESEYLHVDKTLFDKIKLFDFDYNRYITVKFIFGYITLVVPNDEIYISLGPLQKIKVSDLILKIKSLKDPRVPLHFSLKSEGKILNPNEELNFIQTVSLGEP